jgi:5'/3'-nucleotidase
MPLTPAQCIVGAGAWRSQVAHSLGVRVVGRSNRLAPIRLRLGRRGVERRRPSLQRHALGGTLRPARMQPTPLILVSNDDGVHSEGIVALAEALREVGEVVVVAPDRERSAVSHSLTLHRPLRVEELGPGRFAVNGTPTDCVNLAINGILGRRPALVVSGINKGANLGDDVTYSGTVSAAMEGTLLGVPSIAVSLVGRDGFRFEPAATFSVRLARWVIERGLPADTLLNVNVPQAVEGQTIRGVALTRMGRRRYGDAIVEKVDPRGKKYYWIGGEELEFEDAEGTDFHAVHEHLVSVTPIHLDLTNYKSFEALKALTLSWP